MLHFPSPDIGLFGRRQRRARGHRIPVSIVAQSHVAPQDRDIACLVDDFGADEALLSETGCQCCTVRVMLQQALRLLLAERGRRHFGRVVIETSQDIPPILRTFATERALGDEFYVESDLPDDAFGGDAEKFVLTEHTPIPWETFSRFMTTLIALRGADLLYVKGTLDIVGCTGPVEVLLMGHLAARPVELEAWPDAERASRVAFITRGVNKKTVRELLDSVQALALPQQASS